MRGAAGKPWYVAAKELSRNVLVVVQDQDHPALRSDVITTGAAHWIAGREPAAHATPGGRRFACTVKLRYRQADQPCEVELRPDGRCVVRTASEQRAVTPGQSAVFFDGSECLGGAVIDATERSSAAAALAVGA